MKNTQSASILRELAGLLVIIVIGLAAYKIFTGGDGLDTARSLLVREKANEHFERASNYAKNEQYDKAIEEYSKCIEIDPIYSNAYHNRGNIYNIKGYYDNAIADYTKAIEINPKDADHYCGRGGVYYNKNEYDKAIADSTKALELNPQHTRARELREKAEEIKNNPLARGLRWLFN